MDGWPIQGVTETHTYPAVLGFPREKAMCVDSCLATPWGRQPSTPKHCLGETLAVGRGQTPLSPVLGQTAETQAWPIFPLVLWHEVWVHLCTFAHPLGVNCQPLSRCIHHANKTVPWVRHGSAKASQPSAGCWVPAAP